MDLTYKKATIDDIDILTETRVVLVFFQVMPTYHNPSGKKAYIMNEFNPEKLKERVRLK